MVEVEKVEVEKVVEEETKEETVPTAVGPEGKRRRRPSSWKNTLPTRRRRGSL